MPVPGAGLCPLGASVGTALPGVPALGEEASEGCGWLTGSGDEFVCRCWEQQPKGALWLVEVKIPCLLAY